MALKQEYLKFINENIENVLGGLKGHKMLELGNQHIWGGEIPEKTGKEYFENRGILHTSVDINGLDGAVVKDLSKPEQFLEWHGRFDIITNSGTSEHVEPGWAQYECFSIIHDCLKVGGVAIHLLPEINSLEKDGCWRMHCANYYSVNFFQNLAAKNDYKIVSLDISGGLVCASLQKRSNSRFMEDRKDLLRYVTRKSVSRLRLFKYAREHIKLSPRMRKILSSVIEKIK